MKIFQYNILQYSGLVSLISFAVLTLAVLVPNIKTITWTFDQSALTLTQKIHFLSTLYGGLATNFTVIGAVFIGAVALLFGINSALFVFYIRKMRHLNGVRSMSAASFGGLMSGFFGIGCASCGSVIIVALFGQLGAGAFIATLPYGGYEFSILAIAILSYTTYRLAQKIKQPAVCEIVYVQE
jgi:hypothetical protein